MTERKPAVQYESNLLRTLFLIALFTAATAAGFLIWG